MINLIPQPAKYEERFGEFILNEHISVYSDRELSDAKDMFIDIIHKVSGYELPTVLVKEADICFLYDNHQSAESYIIDCTSDKLSVYASTYAGALYAVQTLRQLFQADLFGKVNTLSMHAVYVEDKPRFSWRGLMLDEARWFFGPIVVKRLLDAMSAHKLNVFHWHLTDNEGWRIEIKKYPKLTEIGSKRAGTQHICWGKYRDADWTPVEGFYTQEEIKDIVAYAAKLNITVVPEIDMPAHFAAAVASYPWLSCQNKKLEVPVFHGGLNQDANSIIACAGKDTTYEFIYDVLDEISELFPSPYFHIGGDEAPKREWKECPLCQKVIKDNGLENEEELQGYFTNKIALYLKTKGKRLIGWNEVLKSKNLDDSFIAQYWVPSRDKNVEEYASAGKSVIMSKHQAFYFDMPYAMRNLKSTYNFEPEDYNVWVSDGGLMGVEATVWTEWIMTTERLEFQIFPRMEALAEVAWSPKDARNYRKFKARLRKYVAVLDRKGVMYCPETLWDRHGIGAKIISAKFHATDAHCEFKKAVAIIKRKHSK